MQPLKFLFIFVLMTFQEESVFSLKNGSELMSVVIIFRHGARTIIKPYPNDPYKNESLWPVGFGQLTNEGKMQHYLLGQYFRDRYKDFIPSKYSEKLFYVRSTDVDRTLMSAAANLAGFYPPEGNQVWDTDIPWQPIPIHTVPEQQDAFLAFKKPCPKYDALFKDLMSSEEIVKINEDNRQLYEYLSLHSGQKIFNFDEMEYLYNTLTIEKNNSFTLPEWTKPVFPDKMKGLAALSFALPAYTKELARLKTGPFLYDLLHYFKNVTGNAVGSDYIKMKIFSGHDTTVANILESLRMFDYHSPPFRSSVIFELYRNQSGNHYVNILYKNSSIPQKMSLKGCQFDCPLEEFDLLVSPLSISMEMWKHECQLSLLLAITENKQNLVVACTLVALMVCFVAITAKLVYNKSKRDRAVYFRLPDDEEQV